MKPFIHAQNSAKQFGGTAEDYLDIHNFMDSSKAAIADVRHRAILHNAFGCFIVEQLFGVTRTNSEGKVYSPRDVAEQHILEDLGTIPSVGDWLDKLPIEGWMSKPQTNVTTYSVNEKFLEEIAQTGVPELGFEGYQTVAISPDPESVYYDATRPMTPSDMIKLFTELDKQSQAAQKQVQELGLTALAEYFKPIFEDPNVAAIAWTQCTPYFNDGEPCVFSVGTMEVLTTLTEYGGEETGRYPEVYGISLYEVPGYDEEIDDDEECGGLRSLFSYYSYSWGSSARTPEYPFHERFQELIAIHDNDDLCKALFGDHSSVLITKDGIQVGEYDHD